MLYYDRIDVRKEVDPTKSNKSREYMICHYFFLNHGFILLLSLLKIFIIVVLFITLANMKQLIY